MKNALRKYITEQVTSPKKEEVNEILSLFRENQFQKGEFFKEPSKTGNYLGFFI